ncbi:MAG: hypothetical protein IKO93_23305 [Lentisphaeria bacterium]|nr:hypothetical protein [Lentisphaeria bacterium]
MEIFAIPAVLICLLYLIYQSIQDKKSPVITLLCIALFVGLTAFAASLYAAIRTSYHGQPEWAVEKAFFLGMFADKLAETNDLKTAAEFMQSESVKEQTLRLIRQIVLSFRPKAVFCLPAGGLILLLSAVSLWIKRIAGNKFYPFLLVFFVLAGGILLDLGIYYRQYASGTDEKLKTILRIQQTSVMQELAETKTDLSIPEIIRLTRKTAGESKGYDYGYSLLLQLQKKDKGGK